MLSVNSGHSRGGEGCGGAYITMKDVKAETRWDAKDLSLYSVQSRTSRSDGAAPDSLKESGQTWKERWQEIEGK